MRLWTTSLSLACCWALLVAPAARAGEGSLEVATNGLRSAEGQVLLLLFRGPEGFLDGDRAVAALEMSIEEARAGKELGAFDPGGYAVVLCHDENGNGTCDLNWLGIPKEGVGFSNDARSGVTGPPSFADARIDLASGERRRLQVTLRY